MCIGSVKIFCEASLLQESLHATLVGYVDVHDMELGEPDSRAIEFFKHREYILGIRTCGELHARQFYLYVPSEASRLAALRELYTQAAKTSMQLVICFEDMAPDKVCIPPVCILSKTKFCHTACRWKLAD